MVSAATPGVGDRIRELRGNEGLTQAKLARLLKVQRETVAMWETERHGISLDNLDKIADLTRCNLKWLRFGPQEDSDA